MEATVTARPLAIEPLTLEGFAPFGSVIMAERDATAPKLVNQGTARRYDWLTALENSRPARARLNLCVFRCAPRSTWPFKVELLEKHPESTQLFVPMNAARYLVLVALEADDAPDLSTLRAFLATGRQGIAYHPGIWHHPLLALDQETDFACLVHEDGSDDDCRVHTLPTEAQPFLDLAARDDTMK